ncbi:alpha-tocopherol transfer protein-like [Uloborus diversus]|uniref:alpha-tocopherol transfer protein-like n=1 Tax=Uloborus diversus TaxID=327109 RepID=UPI00240A26D4|nr:alpha-tocopherol transfer protein-like [Uloborus diversus]
MPYRARNHSAVVVNYHGLLNPSKVPIEEKFSLDMLAVERALGNPMNQLCGASVLLDFKEFNLWKMLALTPQVARMYVEFLQNSFPLRLKSIICLNTPTIFSLLFNIIYPLLSKKLRSRLMVHSINEGWENLHAVLPPEILPEAYGGKIKKSSLIDLCERIEDHEEYFQRHLDYGFIKSKHHHD